DPRSMPGPAAAGHRRDHRRAPGHLAGGARPGGLQLRIEPRGVAAGALRRQAAEEVRAGARREPSVDHQPRACDPRVLAMPNRRAIIQAFIPNSPHAAALGIRLASIGTDEAVLEMPFKDDLVTIGEVVHGGAVSALIDTAAMAAAWASDEGPESPAGSTAALAANFAAPAQPTDL